MILLRQKYYSSKFWEGTKGAKKSEDEASNLAAYRVVAGEDEFKKNREVRKIKSGQMIYSINNDNMILLRQKM